MLLLKKIHQYQFIVSSADEESQRKGIVGIMWMKGDVSLVPEQGELESESKGAATRWVDACLF